MPSREQINRLLNKRILPIILGMNVVLLLTFLSFNYLLIFHSDSAVKNLLAQEIWDTGQYFPRDWNYVNNDLWVFYTQTFIIPLLGWFKNGFNLHVVSDLVSAALILLGSWLITGMLGQSRNARLVSMILVTAGMSLIFAEHVFGQAAYGSMYYMGCFLVYSYWKLSHARGRAALLWGVATFVLAALVFWANPQRALLYYGAPLFTAAFALLGLNWSRAQGAPAAAPSPAAALPPRQWRWPLLLAVGCLAGVALHHHYIRRVYNSEALTLDWLPYEAMISNLLAFTRGFLNMFEGLPRPEIKVVSLWGGYMVLRLLAALAALVLLPWSVFKSIQPHHRGRMFFAVFTLVALAGNLLVILTTSLANMGSPEASVRYLVPTMLGMLLLMAGVIVDRRHLKPGTRAIGIFTLIVLGTSAPMTYVKPFDKMVRFPLRETRFADEHVRLGYFLEQNNLHYGYSPFWSAGKITVLTQQRVKVRQVVFDKGLPMPMRTLSSNRWYRPEAWTGETFLAVQDTQQLDLPRLFQLMGQPVRLLRFEKSWFIYVFAGNLAQIPSWDFEGRKPRPYPVDEHSPHLIGQVQTGADQPPALVAEPNEYGPLLFGAQPGVIPGPYLVTFDVEANGAPQDFGTVEVCVEACTKMLANQAIVQAGRQKVTVRFKTRHDLSLLEFRVMKKHGGQLKVRGVELRRDLSAEQAS
jgi:hypothetical protein